MRIQKTFKRCEMKYMLEISQYEALKELMLEYMKLDEFGKHVVHSIYMDTKDYLLIRRSIEKPRYKEKLRIRGYGSVAGEDQVFVELKKKFKGIVYKRRMQLAQDFAYKYIAKKVKLTSPTQIAKEIDYFLSYYEDLSPAMMISCDREAYFCTSGGDFRITFDRNVVARDYDMEISKGAYGSPILESGKVLLEVKSAGAIPLWLSTFFSENKIYKTSFSKYGTAYKKLLLPKINEQQKGVNKHVA